MRKPKLVASDLDGTLLLNGTQSLGPEACGLIHRLHENGILFLAASGRQYCNLQKLFAPVKDEIAYLCDNGCRSYYQGRTLSLERMDRALGDEIISAVMAAPGCEVLMSGDECSYAQPKNPEFSPCCGDFIGVTCGGRSDIHAIPEPYVKISLFAENVLSQQEYWKEKFGGKLHGRHQRERVAGHDAVRRGQGLLSAEDAAGAGYSGPRRDRLRRQRERPRDAGAGRLSDCHGYRHAFRPQSRPLSHGHGRACPPADPRREGYDW
jgi:hypothetical protein